MQRAFHCLSPDSNDGSVRWLGREADDGKTGRAARLNFKLDRLSHKQQAEDPTGKLEWWLPIRPVLLGGDDLTFLCDGRIALDLAAEAIRAIEQVGVRHLGESGETINIKACAGVAIVPHHSPFIRSYELAEHLCQSAKKVAREHAIDHPAASFIDWHVGLPKPSVSLMDLRKREYRSADQKWNLTCRPYQLGDKDAVEVGTWVWLDQMLLDLHLPLEARP